MYSSSATDSYRCHLKKIYDFIRTSKTELNDRSSSLDL